RKIYPVETFNFDGVIYVDAIQFFKGLEFNTQKDAKNLFADYDSVKIELTIDNPFVKLKNIKTNEEKIYQLAVIPKLFENKFFLPLKEITEIINLYTKRNLQFLSSTRIRVTDKSEEIIIKKPETPIKIISISIKDGDEKSEIRILTDRKIENLYNYYSSNDLFIYLWNVQIKTDSLIESDKWSILKNLLLKNEKDFVQLAISLKKDETVTEMLKGKTENEIIIRIAERDFGSWYMMESEHFKLIYRDAHSHLADYLLKSAENSFKALNRFFDFHPNEKIIINTYDVND
ncbi:MAG: hypothetical protein ACK4UV_00060, partial [Ignavibacterium sp.]